jgi:general secretion pathway protein K
MTAHLTARPGRHGTGRRDGVVLLIVLFFALLLTSSIATFTRRSLVDTVVARNREAAARAESLARGGISLASALLSLDRIAKQASALPIDSHLDAWYHLRAASLPVGEDATLRIQIDDSGALLNLNAVFDAANGGAPFSETEPFLRSLLDKVVEELGGPAEAGTYEVADLTEALIDWVDTDSERNAGGGYEDDVYQSLDPPYRSANRPLLSVDELLLIDGFDRPLVDALRQYVTVYPYVGGGGVNLNTAPAHVLALIFSNEGQDDELAHKDQVKRILDVRAKGGVLCGGSFNSPECTPINTIVPNPIFPEPTYTAAAFKIVAEAQVGEVRRTVEAVIDRSSEPPLRLSWKVR